MSWVLWHWSKKKNEWAEHASRREFHLQEKEFRLHLLELAAQHAVLYCFWTLSRCLMLKMVTLASGWCILKETPRFLMLFLTPKSQMVVLSCRLGVPSTLLWGKAVYPLNICILMTCAMNLTTGHVLGALTLIQEEERVSWACFAKGVSSSRKGVPSTFAWAGCSACCFILLLDIVSMFDAEDGHTGQWLVHFERDTALFNAFFNP